jgi:hypothetical protein
MASYQCLPKVAGWPWCSWPCALMPYEVLACVLAAARVGGLGMFGRSGWLAAQHHIRAELVLDAVTAERYCLNLFLSAPLRLT